MADRRSECAELLHRSPSSGASRVVLWPTPEDADGESVRYTAAAMAVRPLPGELLSSLPRGIDQAQITHHVHLRGGPDGLLGETHLLVHDEALLVLTRGSQRAPFRLVDLDPEARTMLVAESWSVQLCLPVPDGESLRFDVSSRDVATVLGLLSAVRLGKRPPVDAPEAATLEAEVDLAIDLELEDDAPEAPALSLTPVAEESEEDLDDAWPTASETSHGYATASVDSTWITEAELERASSRSWLDAPPSSQSARRPFEVREAAEIAEVLPPPSFEIDEVDEVDEVDEILPTPAERAEAEAELAAAKAQIAEAELAAARLAEAKLAEAKLAEAKLAAARLAEARLAEAQLAEAKLAEAKLAEAKLAEARLAAARLAAAKVAEAAQRPLLSWKRPVEPFEPPKPAPEVAAAIKAARRAAGLPVIEDEEDADASTGLLEIESGSDDALDDSGFTLDEAADPQDRAAADAPTVDTLASPRGLGARLGPQPETRALRAFFLGTALPPEAPEVVPEPRSLREAFAERSAADALEPAAQGALEAADFDLDLARELDDAFADHEDDGAPGSTASAGLDDSWTALLDGPGGQELAGLAAPVLAPQGAPAPIEAGSSSVPVPEDSSHTGESAPVLEDRSVDPTRPEQRRERAAASAVSEDRSTRPQPWTAPAAPARTPPTSAPSLRPSTQPPVVKLDPPRSAAGKATVLMEVATPAALGGRSIHEPRGGLRFNFEVNDPPPPSPTAAPATPTAEPGTPRRGTTPASETPRATVRRVTPPPARDEVEVVDDEESDGTSTVSLAAFFDAHVPAADDDPPRPRRVVPGAPPSRPSQTEIALEPLAPIVSTYPGVHVLPPLEGSAPEPVDAELPAEAPSTPEPALPVGVEREAAPEAPKPRKSAAAAAAAAVRAAAEAAKAAAEAAKAATRRVVSSPAPVASSTEPDLEVDLEADGELADLEIEEDAPRMSRRLATPRWAKSAASAVAASTGAAASAAVSRARTAATRLLDRQRSRNGKPRRNRRRVGVGGNRLPYAVAGVVGVLALFLYWVLPGERGDADPSADAAAEIAGADAQILIPEDEAIEVLPGAGTLDPTVPAAGVGPQRSLQGALADAEAPTPAEAPTADRDFRGIATLTAESPEPVELALKECRSFAQRGLKIRVKVEIDEATGTVPEVWVGDSSNPRELRHCINRQFKKASFVPRRKGKLIKEKLSIQF